MMIPLAPLALAARSRPAARRPHPKAHPAPAPADRAKASGTRLAWRLAAALAGGLILMVALVDPLLGTDRYGVHADTPSQGVRHE